MDRRRLRLILLAVVGLALAVAGPTAAVSAAPEDRGSPPVTCAPFTATGTGQDLGNGQTTATVFVGGIRVGTTTASFTVTGVSGSVASFAGTLTFRPDELNGTLVAPVLGTLDLTTGAFVATSSSVTGTRRLTPVTGDVRIEGVQDLVSGAFTETLTGRLCVPGRQTADESGGGGRTASAER